MRPQLCSTIKTAESEVPGSRASLQLFLTRCRENHQSVLTLKLLELTQELATASTILSSVVWSCSSSGDFSWSRMSSMISWPTWSLFPRSFCITCSSKYSMLTSSSMAAARDRKLKAQADFQLAFLLRVRPPESSQFPGPAAGYLSPFTRQLLSLIGS